jgi:hypothetical protein
VQFRRFSSHEFVISQKGAHSIQLSNLLTMQSCAVVCATMNINAPLSDRDQFAKRVCRSRTLGVPSVAREDHRCPRIVEMGGAQLSSEPLTPFDNGSIAITARIWIWTRPAALNRSASRRWRAEALSSSRPVIEPCLCDSGTTTQSAARWVPRSLGSRRTERRRVARFLCPFARH